MKCVITGGGNIPSKEVFLKAIKDADYFIAADKGAEIYYKYDVKPDLIMGDFDSLDKDVANKFKEIDTIRFLPEKDDTDSLISLKKAIELGYDDIILLGMTGTRLDHTFANIGMLKTCLKLNVKGTIIDDTNIIKAFDKSFQLEGDKGRYFSLFAFSEVVENLSIRNAKYEASNHDLYLGDGIGVSNEFIGQKVNVSFDNGIIIAMISID